MSDKTPNSVKKLYSSISRGLGGRIIPSEIRKMLDNEYALIEVNDETELVPSIFTDSEMALPEVETLYKNTCSRLFYQEMNKQKNIEDVVAKTAGILAENDDASEELVDEDWITRFFNSIQDVSNEKMQELWSRILAGEINNPNSFSLRTLDAMTKMSSEEAALFESIYPFIIDFNGVLAIIRIDDINNKYEIPYGKILRLSECGLIEASGFMSTKLIIDANNSYKSIYGDLFLEGTVKEGETKISIPIYKLTTIGIELLGILKKSINYDYFREIEGYLAKENSNIRFIEYKVVKRNGNQISYETNGKEIITKDDVAQNI